MQRIFRAAAVLLTAVMVLFPAMPAAAAAAATPPTFSDVSSDHPDRIYIEYLAAHGLISGYPDGRFGPDDPLTRAAATKIAVQVAGLAPLQTGAVDFTDVPDTHWSLPYVRAGVGAKLVNGFDDKTFRPDEPLTRAQLAALAIRATRQPTNFLPDLKVDDVQATDWYYQPALLALASGMMLAKDGKFRPNDVATRAEAARAFAEARVYTPAAFSTPLTATVEPKSGTVEIKGPNDKNWTAITEKTDLPVGGRVRTAGASTANILFPDASAILLDPVTEVVLVKSRGTELVTGPGVEELQVDLVKGHIYTSVTPRVTSQELQAYGGYLARFTDKAADARAAAAMAPRLRAAAEATGENLPDGATRLQIWADPASLEPGDKTGADITVVLVDDAGEPVTADKGDVTIQVLSDVGTVSNSNPVIPKGYNAVTIKLTPPKDEPADAKTRVTAVAGDLSTALTIPTATVHWWEALFTKKVRAQVRMPYSVASVRGTFGSFSTDPETGDQVTVAAGNVTVTSVSGDSTDVGSNQTSTTSGPTSAPTPPSTPPPSVQQQLAQRLTDAQNLYDQAVTTAPPSTVAAVQAEKQLVGDLLATVERDEVAPSVAISVAGSDKEIGTETVQVHGTASDNVSLQSVTVNGSGVSAESSSATSVTFSAAVKLKPGPNTITATATDGSGNSSTTSLSVTFNPAAPSITLSGPKTTKEKTATISGTVKAPGGIKSVSVNGKAVDAGSGSFTATVQLQPGRNTVSATVTDQTDKTGTDELTIISASVPPSVTLNTGETKVGKKLYPVSGSVQTLYADLDSLTINGTAVNVGADGHFAAAITLKPGPNTITAVATDVVGNQGTATQTVTLDAAQPTISIDSPSDNLYTKTATLTVSGSITAAAGIQSVNLNGANVSVPDGATGFSGTVALKEGANTITATVTDLAGNTASATKTVYLVTKPPTVVISSPSEGKKIATKKVTVSGSAAASQGPLAGVSVNGQTASVGTDGGFSTSITLKPGANVITAAATDAAGNTATTTVTVTFKPDKPVINLSAPKEGLVVKTSSVAVSGTIDNAQDITSVSVGGSSASLSADGNFSTTVPLLPGKNTITVSLPAEFEAATATRTVIYADRPPTLSVGSPADGATVAKPDLPVSGNAMTSYGQPAIVTVNGQVAPVSDSGNFSVSIKPKPGDNTITVTAADPAGNITTLTRKVKYKPDAPVISIASPSSNMVTKDKKVTVSGSAFSPIGLKSVTINGAAASADSAGNFSGSIDLKPGKNTITVVATDTLDAQSTATVTVTSSGGPPTVSIGSPSNGFTSGKAAITVSGSARAAADGIKIKSVSVNGSPAAVSPDGSWVTQVTLQPGKNSLVASATDELDNSASSSPITVTYAQGAPTLMLGAPGDHLTVKTPTITVSGQASASTPKFSVTVNGAGVTVDANGNFATTVKLKPGPNTITATVTDDLGRSTSLTRTVTLTAEPLAVTISSPANGATVTSETVPVSGSVTGAGDAGATVTINSGQRQTTTAGFSGTVTLNKGANTISVSASDTLGQTASASVTVTFAPTPPTISMSAVAVGTMATVSGSASSQYGNLVVSVGGRTFNLDKGGSFSTTITLVPGTNVITATATDKYGSASASQTVTYTPSSTGSSIVITSPAQNPAWSKTGVVTVSGTAAKGASLRLTVDGGSPVTRTASATDGSFSFNLTLPQGNHVIRVADTQTPSSYSEIHINVDQTAPVFDAEAASVGTWAIVSGTYDEPNLKDIKVDLLNGSNAVVASATAAASGGSYAATFNVTAGSYQARVTVTDLAGNLSTQTVPVTSVPIAFAHLTPNGSQTGSTMQANLTLDNVPAGLSAGTFELILPAGVTSVTVTPGTVLSGGLTVTKTGTNASGQRWVQFSVARASATTVTGSGTLATLTITVNGQFTTLDSIQFGNGSGNTPGGLLLLYNSGAPIPAITPQSLPQVPQ